MSKKKDINESFTFCLSKDAEGADVLLVGMPRAARDYIADGKTNTADFAAVGLNLKVIVFGAETHQDCLDIIKQANEQNAVFTEERMEQDFSIKTPKAH